jgi:hypothetical protein
MTYYIKHGSAFQLADESALDLKTELPAGTYTVAFNEQGNFFYLETIENLSVSGKIYGDMSRQADRIQATYFDRPNSTGVILSGEKGSGKTMLAKLISQQMRTLSIPTIVINKPWNGDDFNVFMQSIEQEVVVIFDEFEKVYDKDKQESLLTLFDGVYPGRKLFIVTCNDRWRVDKHMRNRPGRIYYRIDYIGLDPQFVREYAEDNLVNKSHIDSLCRISAIFGAFNFDILKAMVEEMNRYDESPQEVMDILNAKPELDEDRIYDVKLSVASKASAKSNQTTWSGNPLSARISLYYELSGDDADDDYHNAVFSASDLKKVDTDSGHFIFENAKGEQVILTRQAAQKFDYNAY